jgi:MoxR-like ATPase
MSNKQRTRLFEPQRVQTPGRASQARGAADALNTGVYVYYDPDIELAVNVALSVGRPLLVSGPSGSGKSSLARSVALTLGWRFYEFVVTARSEANDLLYRFDSIRRLSDAQAGKGILTDAAYLEPGVLWWAFDRDSAIHRGDGTLPEPLRAQDPSPDGDPSGAVLLIDEIDKADSDVPNGLLVALGSLRFAVSNLGGREVGAKRPPLVIITNNGEREMPLPFLRRCVTIRFAAPGQEQLIEIAEAVFGYPHECDTVQVKRLYEGIAAVVTGKQQEERDPHLPPSAAEYLDTVRACLDYEIRPGTEEFRRLTKFTLSKQQTLTGNRG